MYIAAEEWNLIFTPRELVQIRDDWAEGLHLADISRRIERDPNEVFVLLLDLTQQNRIRKRKGGIYMVHDEINSPLHYADTKIEVIDYIEDKRFCYHMGNAVKYISRAGKKGDAITDLRKAIWYLERKIKLLEGVK